MPVLPGTQVQVSFFTFAGDNPPIYDGASGGPETLASVNAGNSDGLCVGLGGINGGFYLELTQHANQKRVNLSPAKGCIPGNYDDYQDRHLKLLAQATAAATGTASAVYANTDPCAFSYCLAKPVGQAAGFHDGVCFVDVFDAALCPHGNAKNAAMLYVAPPLDTNYATTHDFLQAIEATAANIIAAIAGYNALAAQQNLPVIQALRNTLLSSNNYNKTLKAPLDDIAGAILAGFAAELRRQGNCGLQELQFPVGTGPKQSPLFASLQTALGAPPPGGIVVLPEESEETGDDDDDDPNNIELDDVAAQGADTSNSRVNAGSLTNATQAVRNATAQLDGILQAHGQIGANANYGQLPARQAHGYQLPESGWESAAGVHIQPPVPVDPGLTVAGGQAKAVMNCIRASQAPFQNLLAAGEASAFGRDLTALSTARDAIRTQADLATAAADQADQAAQAAENEAVDDPTANLRARASREAAEIARGAERSLRRASRIADRYARLKTRETLASKARVRKMHIAAVGAGGARVAIVLGGILTWVFVFGGGRKVIGSGLARFQIKDLDLSFPDTQTLIDIDILAENGGLELVKAVHLHDAAGAQVDTLTTNEGTWTATGTHVQFVPNGKPASATVSYVLEAVGLPGAVTDPAKLTITFTKGSPAGDPADLVIAAPDRTSPVSFTVPAGFQFASGPPTDTEGKWSYDATKNVALFTPNAGVGVTAVLKAALYRTSADGKMASLTALFPAAPVTGTATDRVSPFTLDAKLPVGSTLLDAQNQPAASVTVTGGTWTLVNSQFTFTPDSTLPATQNQVTVNYAIVFKGVTSVAGPVALTLPAAGTPPVAVNAFILTANRSGAAVFKIANAKLTGNVNDPNGTWSVNAANTEVTFQPKLTGTAQVAASITYVVTGGGQQSAPATLSVTYLAPPALIALPNVSRTAATTVAAVPGTALNKGAITVKLWNGTAAVDSIGMAPGAIWTVSGQSIVFTPAQKQVNSVETVDYVYLAPDQSRSDPAGIRLNFDTKPVARSFVVNNARRYSTVDALFLDHCVIPAGYKDVNSAQFGAGSNGEIWSKAVNSQGTPVIRLNAQNLTLAVVSLTFTVVDQNNVSSDPATVTVDFSGMQRFAPMTADVMVAVAPGGGQTLGADVLPQCSSFYPADAKSVVLTGIQDVGKDNAAWACLVDKSGKSMRVPDEGVWVVDDSGKIIFEADPGFDQPPTPATYRFTDTQGNWSTPGAVVLDPDAQMVADAPKALAAMDDAAFWAEYQKEISRPHPVLAAEDFIAATAAMAGMTLAASSPGPNPVADADYQTAYQAWLAGGQVWDDPAGTAQPVGLVSLVGKLVDAAVTNPAAPLRARYWRLELMTRMAVDAQPLPAGN